MNQLWRQRIETALTVVLTVTAVIVGGVFVRREWVTGRLAKSPASNAAPPVLLAEWRDVRAASLAVGDSGQGVELVVFTDFECPACRRMDAMIKKIQADTPGAISLRVVHYPLTMHRFALPAARAASCAAQQGAFATMYDLLFEKQDSLGLKEWRSYAAEAGIADSREFAACVRRNDLPPEVARGLAMGKRIAIVGTPTLVLGGWRFNALPSESELRSAVRRLLRGVKPS